MQSLHIIISKYQSYILLLCSEINRRPFQQIRSYKIHKENKNKIGQVRSSMQQADYTNVIGPLHECKKDCLTVHAQKPYSCQAFAHESSKVGGRGKEIGKTEARRLMERKAAQ